MKLNCRTLAIVSHAVMWCSGGVAYAQVSAGTPISSEAVTVPVSVFVVSVLASVGFTWAVCTSWTNLKNKYEELSKRQGGK